MNKRASNYLIRAEHFFNACKSVDNDDCDKTMYAPKIFLLGHSLELILKSVIINKDSSVKFKSHNISFFVKECSKYTKTDELIIISEIVYKLYPDGARYPDDELIYKPGFISLDEYKKKEKPQRRNSFVKFEDLIKAVEDFLKQVKNPPL